MKANNKKQTSANTRFAYFEARKMSSIASEKALEHINAARECFARIK